MTERAAEPWKKLRDARNAYGAHSARMISAGIWEQQLRLALASPRGRDTALRILAGRPVEEVMNLLDAVFDAALHSSPTSDLGRAVLARLDPGWLAFALRKVVTDRLDSSDEQHGRMVELLRQLDQQSILEEVIRRRTTRPEIAP